MKRIDRAYGFSMILFGILFSCFEKQFFYRQKRAKKEAIMAVPIIKTASELDEEYVIDVLVAGLCPDQLLVGDGLIRRHLF
jgi:hypothetical protein